MLFQVTYSLHLLCRCTDAHLTRFGKKIKLMLILHITGKYTPMPAQGESKDAAGEELGREGKAGPLHLQGYYETTATNKLQTSLLKFWSRV